MTKAYRLEQSQFIPKLPEEVLSFFADASNLERITPSFLHSHILKPRPIPMKPGTLIDYQLRLCGVPSAGGRVSRSSSRRRLSPTFKFRGLTDVGTTSTNSPRSQVAPR
jgi:hypothetical protein